MIGTQRTLADLGTEHHKLIMSTGRSIELEEIYPQSDGTIRYYQVVKSPVFASDGKLSALKESNSISPSAKNQKLNWKKAKNAIGAS